MLPSPLQDRFRDMLGPKGWLDAPDSLEPFVTEWRGFWRGSCCGVALPENTEQVAAIVRLCAGTGTSIVPHGGNTGLVGGGVPDGGIVLSTRRMNKIRDVDIANHTMTVDAGCILADIQARATEAGLFFPLSLGAEGTCQIGGNLSTNAGGVAVLRYGNARDLALGLEVVLPSGEVWDGMKGLRKDNAGYDLKHLFIGAEGTLGVITGAVLKLYPAPKSHQTALVALPTIPAALELLGLLQRAGGDSLTAFELINQTAMQLVSTHIPDARNPFAESHACYVLAELTSPREDDNLRAIMETCFGAALENGIIADAVIAESAGQAANLWRLRESIPEAQVIEGASIKHDISVAVSKTPDFIRIADEQINATLPGTRIVAFGHLGDGNIHYNLTLPEDCKSADGQQVFMGRWDTFNRLVHDIAVKMGGSFSAEHGIGQLKRDDLGRYASPIEISMMRGVKAAMDPDGIMNPGKVIPD